MNYNQTKNFMKQAVPLARQMEGDWNLRMSLALKSVMIDHFMKEPISKEVIRFYLQKGFLIVAFVSIMAFIATN
ncbi:Uncharacterised protein [Listeria grayi]|uniref:Uncharacterized protein n=1 Tax=Listeria grayi TaxID=1641 RepID=A0A378MCX6_LISGR|nr:Uncharacterised protein [Listeria grayi]